MNCPEKIAGAYLRLNGFFLLPQFTLFDGNSHTHVDFLALRPPKGREICNTLQLPVDQNLFQTINRLMNYDPFLKLLGVVVEVRGGGRKEIPSGGHIDYAKKFFGEETSVISISFAESPRIQPFIEQNTVLVPLKYALKWTLFRFHWMNKNLSRLSKSGSWYLSEDFLADLLFLQKLGIPSIDSGAYRNAEAADS